VAVDTATDRDADSQRQTGPQRETTMRAPSFLCSSALAAAVTTGCATVRTPAALPWTIGGGWLTAPGVSQRSTGPALSLRLADHGDLPALGGAQVPAVSRGSDGTLEVSYRQALGTLVDVYRPFPALGSHAWQRSVRYTNTTTDSQDLTGLELALAPDARPDGTAWRPWTFRMQEVQDRRLLCTAYWASVEPAELSDDKGVIRCRVGLAWRLAPGQTAELGYQGIWVGRAGTEECRTEARRWYAAHGFHTPLRYPRWLLQCPLYELSAGGHIDSRFSDVGGFDALAHQVPYLADLGVTAVWLNAVQQHKSLPDPVRGGWNHYDPRDFAAVDPILGGPEGLRRLLRTFRDHDIHVLGEIVPHGGHARQAADLPQWWSRNRDGSLRRNWGGYGMDVSSPEWQAVVRDSMAMVATLGDLEGARIDVADGQGPNWGSPRTPRASWSALAGSVEMLAAVRDGIRRGGCRTPVLIPESADRPVYFTLPAANVLGYGWGLTNLLAQMPDAVLLDATELDRRLRAALEQERGSLPPGALVLRTLNNHDTVCDKGRVQLRFGAGLHRALYGVCLSIPGVPMLYQEEEVGSYAAIRALNAARRALPWLGDGHVMYPAEGFLDPRVFAAWRTQGRQRALCLANLSGETVGGRAVLPEWTPATGAVRLVDAISGRGTTTAADGRFAWDLAPYETAFLCLDRAPRARLLAERFAGEAGVAVKPAPEFAVNVVAGRLEVSHGGVVLSFGAGAAAAWEQRLVDAGTTAWSSSLGTVLLQRSANRLDIRCELRNPADATPAVVRVQGADCWGLSGRTALLQDRLVQRHFQFPAAGGYRWDRTQHWGYAAAGGLYRGVAPCDRLWQALLEPLHPTRPGMGFVDRRGRGLALVDLQTDAVNVVLSDAGDAGPSAPPCLEARFLASDPDLQPDVQRFGPHSPWHSRNLPALPARGLSVAFTLVPLDHGFEDVLAAERLPRQTCAPEEHREGEHFGESGGRVFMPTPGRITWSGLPAVEAACRIEFELRLSERSGEDTDLAGAYRVCVDGVEQPLTWGRKNVWSTGNAYFALATTPPLDLRGGTHSLSIETLHTWCALRPRFALVAPSPTNP